MIENTKYKTRNSQLIGEALQIAVSQKGPVHINVPFDEPLYETVPEFKASNFPNISISSLDNSHINYKKLAVKFGMSPKRK